MKGSLLFEYLQVMIESEGANLEAGLTFRDEQASAPSHLQTLESTLLALTLRPLLFLSFQGSLALLLRDSSFFFKLKHNLAGQQSKISKTLNKCAMFSSFKSERATVVPNSSWGVFSLRPSNTDSSNKRRPPLVEAVFSRFS